MVERQDWIEEQGWKLVLVHSEHAEAVPPSLGNLPLRSVHHLNDPKCELFAAFGLSKGSIRELLGPSVMWRGLKAIIQGHLPGKPGSNLRQMPGAFIVADGEIHSTFRAKNAGDLPDLEAMAEEFVRRFHR